MLLFKIGVRYEGLLLGRLLLTFFCFGRGENMYLAAVFPVAFRD